MSIFNLLDLVKEGEPELRESWFEPLEGEHLFRVSNSREENVLYLEACKVLRRTKKGCWVSSWEGEKFINFDWHKRYAYETKKAALKSFIARRKRQIAMLAAQRDRAVKQLETAEALLKELTP